MFLEMGMGLHACNPSKQAARAGGYKFLVILGYRARPCVNIFLKIVNVNTVTKLWTLYIKSIFFILKQESSKNAKIHTVICFTPFELFICGLFSGV